MTETVKQLIDEAADMTIEEQDIVLDDDDWSEIDTEELRLNNPRDFLEDFEKWCASQGCTIKNPTSEWEVLRFKVNGKTFIVYQKGNGGLNFTGGSWDAYRAFARGVEKYKPFIKKDPQISSSSRPISKEVVSMLLKRDGDQCFYCGKPMGANIDISWFIEKWDGGLPKLSNLTLAHPCCAARVRGWSVIQKVRHRDALLKETELELVNGKR